MGNEKRKTRAQKGTTPPRQPKAMQQTKLWDGKEFRSSPSSSPLPEIPETEKHSENQGVDTNPTADANAQESNTEQSAFTPIEASRTQGNERPPRVSTSPAEEFTKKVSNKKKIINHNGNLAATTAPSQDEQDDDSDKKPAAKKSAPNNSEEATKQGDGWFLSDEEELSEIETAVPSTTVKPTKPAFLKHAQKAARAALAANAKTASDRAKH